MTPSDHEVQIDWHPAQTGVFWNELCANILEVFGLPGDRYISHPTADFMTFTFKNKKDADMCRILLSEHL